MSDGPATKPLAPEPLTGGRVRLLPAAEAHIPALAGVFADPSVSRWWPAPDPIAEAREHVEPEPNRAVWAIETEGDIVGLIQAWEDGGVEFRHAGIDLAVRSSAQNRGLGPDAIRAVARWLFEVRGHHRLTIDPALENERAVRAYTKVGFRPVGVLRRYQLMPDGAWHDGLLMDLLPGELLDG